MKVSDYVFDFFSGKGVTQAFGVTGGAAGHLFDSIHKYPINLVHMHHEQACAMAADGYARVAKKASLVLLTNGPGVSNAITGVLGAFQDSIPMVIISGQVSTRQMLSSGGGVQRQFGVQEVDTGKLVSSIVKYFKTVNSVDQLGENLEEAWLEANSGRPGPVWIEIPLDIQSDNFNRGTKEQDPEILPAEIDYTQACAEIENSKRPIIVIGGGVHLSNCEESIVALARTLRIPVISTWGAIDVFNYDDPLYVGNFGILGNRAANIALQESDLLLILGSRLSIPNTGYATELFSVNSKKIMVNIDRTEIEKSSLKIDFVYACDLAQWISDFPIEEIQVNSAWLEWEQKLNKLKILLDIKNEAKSIEDDRIDAYTVVEILSRNLRDNSVLVTDMGTSFTCTMQSFQRSQDVRIFTSSGTSSMGFGLPGAIGAHFADPTKRIVLIAGDGGFQMNIQELQTIKYHNIPIAIVILNSEGYLAISIMQKNIFDSNFVGSNPDSGIDAPDFSKVSIAFGISAERVSTSEELESKFNSLSMNTGPFLLEIMLPSDQVMRPRSQSMKDETGKIYSVGLDIMWPYLDQKMKNQVDQIIN